jgi:hypothetical protein
MRRIDEIVAANDDDVGRWNPSLCASSSAALFDRGTRPIAMPRPQLILLSWAVKLATGNE